MVADCGRAAFPPRLQKPKERGKRKNQRESPKESCVSPKKKRKEAKEKKKYIYYLSATCSLSACSFFISLGVIGVLGGRGDSAPISCVPAVGVVLLFLLLRLLLLLLSAAAVVYACCCLWAEKRDRDAKKAHVIRLIT